MSGVNFNEVDLYPSQSESAIENRLQTLHPTSLQRPTAATNASSIYLTSLSDMGLGRGEASENGTAVGP